MLADPAADHSLAAMAARVAVSPRHLTRLFRAELGTTPGRWLERVRLDRAQQLLLAGVGVTTAARDSGLGSDETLRRAFAHHLGTTPSEYRARFASTGGQGAPVIRNRERRRSGMSRSGDAMAPLDEAVVAFWRERHLCTLTTLRPDGSPHVVPVGSTLDPETGTARIISNRHSRKVRNVLAAGESGMRVALCQVDGARWATLEGVAVVEDAAGPVAEAVSRYAERYRQPRENPDRVVIVITVDRVLGKG